MKTLKTLLLFAFMVISAALHAQQIICSPELKNYIVDAANASPDGSYEWTLQDAVNVDRSSEILNGTTNNISIDWSSTTFDGYTLPHTFTLTVIETVDGCSGEPETFTVTLQAGYDAPDIAAIAGPICTGDLENFTLTDGTPGAIVTYTVTSNNPGFTPVNATVTLDAAGNGTVAIPALTDSATSETFTLTLTTIDDDGTDSCDALTLTPAVTASITVNPIPTTSPITPLN